jgi:RNA polymerase sigma-70 factor (ECF subfamily)
VLKVLDNQDYFSTNGDPRWDPSNFEKVVVEFQGRLYGYIYSMVRDPELALDLVNDSFYLAYKDLRKKANQPGGVDQKGNFTGWLFKIAHNRALDAIRRSRKFTFFSLSVQTDQDENDLSYEDLLGNSFQEQLILNLELEKALKKIKPQRLALFLLFVEGFTYQELANQTGLPLGSIKSRLYRIRRELREILVA